jgi:hypothetical protein
MDWMNVDMQSPSERSASLIDGLTFEVLLLEIGCNVRDITPASVMAQFEEDLQSRIAEARQVMEANLLNITREAIRERNHH